VYERICPNDGSMQDSVNVTAPEKIDKKSKVVQTMKTGVAIQTSNYD